MLGRHIHKGQRRKFIRRVVTGILIGFMVWILWPKGTPQTPTSAPSAPISAPQTNITPYSAPPITNTPVTSGSVGIPAHSGTSGTGGISTTTAPQVATVPAGTTTTTGPSIPPADAINYGAAVDPRFQQDPKNPLHVTYQMSASASILVSGGQFVPVASLPAGTLTLFSNLGQICSMSVSGTVTGETCSTTYPSFASYQVVANYVVNGTTYISPLLSDNVQPFSTTVVASIKGGGSLGGLVFDANVTDSNGNAVTVGSVSMTIADVTQSWSYQVTAQFGEDGGSPNAFSCILVENYPSVGIYGGCLTSGQIRVTPQTGDVLTEAASYSGATDWTASSVATITYAMP